MSGEVGFGSNLTGKVATSLALRRADPQTLRALLPIMMQRKEQEEDEERFQKSLEGLTPEEQALSRLQRGNPFIAQKRLRDEAQKQEDERREADRAQGKQDQEDALRMQLRVRGEAEQADTDRSQTDAQKRFEMFRKMLAERTAKAGPGPESPLEMGQRAIKAVTGFPQEPPPAQGEQGQFPPNVVTSEEMAMMKDVASRLPPGTDLSVFEGLMTQDDHRMQQAQEFQKRVQLDKAHREKQEHEDAWEAVANSGSPELVQMAKIMGPKEAYKKLIDHQDKLGARQEKRQDVERKGVLKDTDELAKVETEVSSLEGQIGPLHAQLDALMKLMPDPEHPEKLHKQRGDLMAKVGGLKGKQDGLKARAAELTGRVEMQKVRANPEYRETKANELMDEAQKAYDSGDIEKYAELAARAEQYLNIEAE